MKLNENEIMIVKRLFSLSKKILKKYQELASLEMAHEKNSEKYLKERQQLDILIGEEESIYNYLQKNAASLGSIIIYLRCSESEINDYLNAARFNDEKMMIYSRIDERLTSLLSSEQFFSQSKFTKNSDISIYQIVYEIECDIASTILKILDDVLNKMNSLVIKKFLLQFKYNLSFIYKHLEIQFLNNDFNISKDLYWCSKLYSDYKMSKKDSEEVLNDLKWMVSASIMSDYLPAFLEYENKEYAVLDVLGNLTILRIIVSSALKFFSPDLQEVLILEAKNSTSDGILSEYICDTIKMGIEEDFEVNILSLKKD